MARLRPTDDPIARQSDLDAIGEFLQGIQARQIMMERVMADVISSLEEVEETLFPGAEGREPFEDVEAEEENDYSELALELGQPDAGDEEERDPTTPRSVAPEEVERAHLASVEEREEAAEFMMSAGQPPQPGDKDYDEAEAVIEEEPEDPSEAELKAELEAEAQQRHERNAMRRMERAAEGIDEEGPRAFVDYGNAVESAMGTDFRVPGEGKAPGVQIKPAEGPRGEEGWSGNEPA